VGICPPYGSEEEQDFMRTMEQVDVWYEAEMAKAEQKAKQENQQEIALKMLRKNMPLDIIAELTELSIERLQSLQSQLETH
jgi:predicted Rossmann fold nucleotide-binding protein DprA/Smf involved in DNA uptake